MRKLILSAIAGGALLASSNITSAIEYIDDNSLHVWLNKFNQSYSGQFNLTDNGYNPATTQIDSAVVTFRLWDLVSTESWNISIEGDESDDVFSGGSFSGFLHFSSAVSASVLGNLDADGILNYTVTRTSGEFWLKNANLTAQASERTSTAQAIARVPDAGTSVALLGLGMLGLLGVRRKLGC